MGRKTWESFGSKPLPHRTNIVLTRDENFTLSEDQGIVLHDIEDATAYSNNGELMVIGGAQIYEKMLPKADRLYCTFIDESFEGDTYFRRWTGINGRLLKKSRVLQMRKIHTLTGLLFMSENTSSNEHQLKG